MILIHSNSANYLPEISKTGLLDMPVQKAFTVEPQMTMPIDLGYSIGLEHKVILDFIICGELRRAGLELADKRHLHTAAHDPLEPITVSVINNSDINITIAASSHAFHALIINSTSTITYE